MVRVISLKPLREFWLRYPDAQQPLREFWLRHPDAQQPLRLWYKLAATAAWRSLQDVRQTFPHADGVRDRAGGVLTVFNIGGNKYRLVARIRYDYQLINIRLVLTHQEYDQAQWRT